MKPKMVVLWMVVLVVCASANVTTKRKARERKKTSNNLPTAKNQIFLMPSKYYIYICICGV